MAIWFWILLLAFFGFAAFPEPELVARAPVDQVAIAVPGWQWEPVTVGGVEGVIVTPGAAPLLVDSLGLDLDGDAHGLPSAADVEAAEPALSDKAGDLDHMRQYAGYVKDGDRKMYFDGRRDASGVDWRERPVLVQDGGDCFFTAIYDVDAGELERFRFNAEA